MSPRPELPDDLQRLGSYLESAAAASVRRHARRQAVMNVLGAIVIAVPFAVAVTAADLSSTDGSFGHRAPAYYSVDTESPTTRFMVRHIPDESLPSPPPLRCLDAKDCRAPQAPSREPAPAGRL